MPRRVIAGRQVGELEAEVLQRLWALSAQAKPLTCLA
jgi:hypothetical protein